MKKALALQMPAFIGVRIAINTMVRMVYPFLPIFGRGLEVDLRMLSLAITIRQVSGLLGPVLASIGDTHGRKRGMLVGVSLFTSAAVVLMVWPGFWGFTLSLILGLMSNYVFITSMRAFIGDRVSYEQRGLYLSLSEISWSLAYILGVPLFAMMIDQNGWLAPFPWLAGAGVFSFVLLWFLLPDDRPTSSQNNALFSNLQLVLRSQPALAGIMLSLTMCASNELINMLFGTWLEQAFAVGISILATAAIVIGFSELGGELLALGFVDRVGKHRSIYIGVICNCLVLITLPLLGSSLPGALVGLFCIFLTFEFSIVATIPLITEVLPTARATFMSLYIAGTAVGRAISDLLLPALYNPQKNIPDGMDIVPVIITAFLFNILALIALQRVKIQPENSMPVN